MQNTQYSIFLAKFAHTFYHNLVGNEASYYKNVVTTSRQGSGQKKKAWRGAVIQRRGNVHCNSCWQVFSDTVQNNNEVPETATRVGVGTIELNGIENDGSAGSRMRQNSFITGSQESSACEEIEQESHAE